MIRATVVIDRQRVGGIRDRISNPPNALFERWGSITREYWYQRYETNGLGRWPPLAQSTIFAKIRAGIDPTRILFWGGTLQEALNPISPGTGALLRIDAPQMSLEVGYGGGIHPLFSGSVEQLAAIHQEGTARIPAREIIVEPPERTITRMEAATQDWVDTIR